MILSAHQPDFCPYIGFFVKMACSDMFDIAIYDQFTKNRWMNRVSISKGMQEWWLTIPVEKPFEVPFYRVKIRDEGRGEWQKEIIDKFHEALHDLPYYNDAAQILDKVLNYHTPYLWELNHRAIWLLRDILGLDTPISISSKLQGKKTQGIIELCDNYHADEYLSGVGGKEYLEEEAFELSNIRLNYLTEIEENDSILQTIAELGIVKTKEKILQYKCEVLMGGKE